MSRLSQADEAGQSGIENQVEPVTNGDPSHQSQRTFSYQGGYSVLRPDEKKRQTIQNQARQESEAYEKYKQQSRPSNVNYVGSVGGGLLDENAARRRQVQETTKYSRIQKQQQYREMTRNRENVEINQKKMEARKKADMNEKRKLDEQKQSEQTWKEDHKKKNEDFLKRLENQSSKSKQISDKAGNKSTINNSTSLSETTTASGYDHFQQESASNTEGFDSRVRALSAMFPDCDVDYLNDLLLQTNSVDAVIDLLQS